MGLFRFYLALCVVFVHSGKELWFGGRRAVEIFFIISGFYMALILTTGKYKNYKTFIVNRFLRLYPIYSVIAILTLVFSFLFKFSPVPQYIAEGKNFDIFSIFYFVFSNLTLIAQELSFFMGLHEGHLYGTADPDNTPSLAYFFLLVPQAWSLSVELMFYGIAPVLLWQKKMVKLIILSLLMLLSIVCRVWLPLMGFPYYPWVYHFFPSVLYLFLLGSLMYHFYENYLFEKFEKIEKNQYTVWFSGAAVVLSGIFYKVGGISYTKFIVKEVLQKFPSIQEHIPLIAAIASATIPYVICAFFICILFYFTSKNRLDRLIGELSYPIYVVHILVMNMLAIFIVRDHSFPYWVAGISILFSAGLVKWVQSPIEHYRMLRLKAENMMQAKLPMIEELPTRRAHVG